MTAETTKYHHVPCNLSLETAVEVSDLITKPDPERPYTKLQEAVIARTSLSESQRLKQLLSGLEMGTQTPSQLLCHMKSLVGETSYVNEKTLWELFRQQMLDNIRPTLTSVIADKTLESAPSAVRSAATTEGAPTNDAISALTRQVEHLNRRLDRLERQGRGRRRNSRTKSSQRSQSSHRYLCWYHFGEKDNKCNEPCNFTKNGFEPRKYRRLLRVRAPPNASS